MSGSLEASSNLLSLLLLVGLAEAYKNSRLMNKIS